VNDLNDIFVFVAVLKHKGFSAAARALKLPKSSISRRVSRLEARLGVRLLERSTRKLRPTEAGATYYECCKLVLADLDEAERHLVRLRSAPMGRIRVSCPIGISQQVLSRLIPDFMAQYPSIQLDVIATNRRIDLIEDQIDVAIRARLNLEDEGMTMRRLGVSRWIFVASPQFITRRSIKTDPVDIEKLEFLSAHEEATQRRTLLGPDGVTKTVTFSPILRTSDFNTVVAAASAGLGMTFLPQEVVGHAIRDGRLRRIFPAWSSEDVTTYLVFTSRRGMSPAVRAFIDFLAEHYDRHTRAPARTGTHQLNPAD
jgi:DNA-binding transcriptional LysR family regulator